MDPSPTATAAALKTLEKKSSTINGTLKKHRPPSPSPPPPPPPPPFLYRECLKNHAASLGGHALDGCGEFMPSADPSSLSCAACGCHRNFHRRIHLHHFHRSFEDNADASSENAADHDDGDEDGPDRQRHQYSSSPPPPSAPHMLLALSTGGMSAGPASSSGGCCGGGGGGGGGGSGPILPRKRFRSKFSPEQKERMLELSERLGWRMQKRDEGIVEERCREIGVGKGVFKVWMHNNKHNFRRAAAAAAAASAAAAAAAAAGGGGGNGSVNGNGDGQSAGFHGSASSSS